MVSSLECHWTYVIVLHFIATKISSFTMLISKRTTRTLRFADDMELAAADVATLVGTVAALASDVFAKDGCSGSSRTRTHSGTAPAGSGHPCRARWTNNLTLCTSEGHTG